MDTELKKETEISVEIAEIAEKYMPYLVEIRRRLFWVVALFLTSSILGFVYYEKIIGIFIENFRLQGVNIVFTSQFQFFNLAFSCALVVGFIVVLPILIWQVLSFLKTALNKKEFRILQLSIPFSLILFASGFAFGVFIMKFVMQIFYAKTQALNIGNYLDLSKLLSEIIVTASLMGLGFQFPLVITLLMKLKIVKYSFFVKQRIPAYVVAAIFAALMPPTDIVSLFLLAFPLVFLFELTLFLNKVILKSHR